MTGHEIEKKMSVARKNSRLRQKIRGDPSCGVIKAEPGRPEVVAAGGRGLELTQNRKEA